MCSEYTFKKKDKPRFKLREKVVLLEPLLKPDIRPTDLGLVIMAEQDDFAGRTLRWGWRVPWDKQPLFNAKAETLTTLPTFKPHLEHRCLIVADGFYEKGVRFIQPGEPVFAMAGLWHPDAEGGRFTMLTTTPNESVSPYHDRMPFILPAELCADWLGPDWLRVLERPDKAALEKIQKQPELF